MKHIILLQTCQENIYYFERHITVKSSTNLFSVLCSIPFSSPVCLLVTPIDITTIASQIGVLMGYTIFAWAACLLSDKYNPGSGVLHQFFVARFSRRKQIGPNQIKGFVKIRRQNYLKSMKKGVNCIEIKEKN